MLQCNQFIWKDMVRWLAQYICNCREELEVLKRERTAPMIPTVYVLFNKETNEIFYVGQTNNLCRRIAQHKAGTNQAGRFNWTHYAYFDPQIPSLHIRLQVEGILTVLCVPPGVQLISLRRTKDHCWKEFKNYLYSGRNKKPHFKINGKTKK